MNINPDPAIASPVLIQRLINQLEDWREQLRQLQIKDRLGANLPAYVDQTLQQDVRLLGVSLELGDVDQITALIDGLKDWMDVTPTVHLTFSTAPSEDVKRTIIEWLQANIDPALIADFKVDGSIAAGFVLRTKNQIYDFTANQVLWDNRRHLGEMVKHAR